MGLQGNWKHNICKYLRE